MKKEDLANHFIEKLNYLISLDPKALNDLLSHRVNCNQLLQSHPGIPFFRNKSKLGSIGLLNSIIGHIDDGPFKGQGYISIVYDNKGNIISFERTDLKDPPLTLNFVKTKAKSLKSLVNRLIKKGPK